MDIKLEDYKKGEKIAQQIVDVMQSSENQLFALNDYQEMKDWLENNSSSGEVTQHLSSRERMSQLASEFEREERQRESTRLFQTISKKQKRNRSFKIIRLSVGIAAALFAISFFVLNNQQQAPGVVDTTTISTGEILATQLVPTLIMSNGNNVDLTLDSVVIEQIAGVKVEKDELDYRLNNKTEMVYNTLIVPKMYTYNVVLSDGTVVYLNANSQLYYPTKFTQETREVFLKGEGFFDVQKSDKPFIVNVNDVKVKVYGTKFNINSYNGNRIKTTLVEGKVGVSMSDSGIGEVFITPNQQLEINAKGQSKIHTVDPSIYTAWVDGYIRNDNETMDNLLNNFARWYGVEFIYSSQIKNLIIEASFSNKLPIEEAITALESIADIKIIKQGGNKYMVL